MPYRLPKRAVRAASLLLTAGFLLVGCEKRTTTTVTPSGTTTTTTIAPSPSAASAIDHAGDVAADALLTAKVKTALLADEHAKALRIDVDTRGGVVTLNGTADSAANASRAETIARGVEGVKSVENRLSIGAAAGNSETTSEKASASASAAAATAGAALERAAERVGRAADKAGDALGDAAITAKVKAALLADAEVKGSKIGVDTHNGIVTLSGTLDQGANIRRAESIARHTDGVKSVENRLLAKAPG
ncbi:MAG: BON domain-containing protein [Rhizobacter sp.]